jgi:glycosyltransferase involved in cell wall biosynthesis
MVKLSSVYPIHCTNRGASHALFSLSQDWQDKDLEARMVFGSCDPICRVPNMVEAIPPIIQPLYYRLFKSNDLRKSIIEKRFLKDLQNFDCAYLWPGISPETFRKVKEKGKPIVIERINTFTGNSKRILDEAYKKLGLSPQHTITPETIKQEEIDLDLAELIFCPSPEVQKSFQEAGVPDKKLILTSYGWDPKRFATTLSAKKPSDDIVKVLFLGSIGVRKGVHLLLRAWERSGIQGRLILFGSIEPAITETCRDLLSRPDVVHIGYSSNNYAYAYREADVFAYPSLEEGSPLVMYEAMAHGLPILTSPMGSGGIVRDGIDGIILDPYDEDAWVECLRKLVDFPELRSQYGTSASQRAQEFTWEKVAAQRRSLLLEKLNIS